MFAVLWKKDAELELAELWLRSKNRAAVTRSIHQIEELLRRDPISVGESRSGKDRIVFDGSVGVSYRVRARSREVVILAVGDLRRR